MSLDTLSADDREIALEFLVAIGDDEFLHAERLRHWLAIAPTLEEDNVLTSLAQDELGHARLWYEIVAEHRDTNVDELSIYRPAADRRNTVLVEREHDGFADTIVRSFVYDHAEQRLLEAIEDCEHDELTSRAGVALNEEPFHREHAQRWLEVFGELDDQDDRDRVRSAVESTLEDAGDLFAFQNADRLVDVGVLGRPIEDVESGWREHVLSELAALPVGYNEGDLEDLLGTDGPNGRRGEHTPDLDALWEQMQPEEIERIDV